MAEKQNGSTAVATTERSPMGWFDRLEREMDDLRQQMMGHFRRPLFEPARSLGVAGMEWTPTVDAYEKDGTFVVKAELPGVVKDDVHVDLRQGLLTISGDRKEEKETKEANFYACERFAGSFSRAFAMPDGVDADKIEAKFKDGVLEVRVPLPAKTEPPSTTIPIKA